MDVKAKVKEMVASGVKQVIEEKVDTVIKPEKAEKKQENTRDREDAKRIYAVIDEREERIKEALASPDLTPDDEQYFIDYLDKLEGIREKVKDRVHKRKMAERKMEHEISKDIAELDIRRQEVAVKKQQADAEMQKAKNEKTKALAIAGGGLLAVGGMTAAIIHGTNTGAAVEMYQNGALTSTTSKNWCPKFGDVSKIIFAPKV